MLKLALNTNDSIMYFICCFKGDKNEVFAGCGDNNIYVWDLESGAQKVRFTVKVLIFMKTNFYGLRILPLFMGFLIITEILFDWVLYFFLLLVNHEIHEN